MESAWKMLNVKILSNYNALMKLWDVFLSTGGLNSEVKSRIIAVQNQMEHSQLFFGLNLSS